MISKSTLAIRLSKIRDFEEHNLKLEQYSTPSEIAADILWKAYMLSDIKGKIVFDPACGPGFLGIGAILLEAKEVIFLDISQTALSICEENLKETGMKNYLMEQTDIKAFQGNADVTIMNPPFGTKTKNADKMFLEVAFRVSPVIYSMHKTSTKDFIEKYSKEHGFKVTHKWRYDYQLKATQEYHRKKIQVIDVTCFRFEKENH